MSLRPEDRAPLSVRPRSLPRRTTIEVDLGGRKSTVLMGTRVGDVLPEAQEGALVVAALVDRRAVSLDAPLLADAHVEPLSTRSWEGREVVRRSAGLLVLEAAARVAPEVLVRIGPSLSSAQVIETPGVREPAALERLARDLQTEVRDLASRDIAFIEEVWAVEEAITHFGRRGWDDAVTVLQYSRITGTARDVRRRLRALAGAAARARGRARRPGNRGARAGGLLMKFGRAITPYLPPGSREVGDP